MRSFIPMPHSGGMVAAMFTHRLRSQSVFKVVDPERDSYFEFAEWCHRTKAHIQDSHFPHIKGISALPAGINQLPAARLGWGGEIMHRTVWIEPWFRVIEVERLLPIEHHSWGDYHDALRVLLNDDEPRTRLGQAAAILREALPHLRSHVDL